MQDSMLCSAHALQQPLNVLEVGRQEPAGHIGFKMHWDWQLLSKVILPGFAY